MPKKKPRTDPRFRVRIEDDVKLLIFAACEKNSRTPILEVNWALRQFYLRKAERIA